MNKIALTLVTTALLAGASVSFGYGAIAQSSDGYYGLSTGVGSPEQARYWAMRYCGHRGCSIQQEFGGQCAAIAIGVQDPTQWWFWIGRGVNRARSEAYRECASGLSGGGRCKVLVSGCD
jgi:hypothetical protein